MNYDIEALKVKMLVKYPFFGSIVANVNYIEDRSIETAATDGKDIYYNPDFIANLASVDEQIFLLAHEVCHIAFNHIMRSEGKIPMFWNIATDAVINQFLKRDGLKGFAGVVDIAEAINYDAEQFYDILIKKHEENKKKQQNNQNGQNSNEKSGGQGSGEKETQNSKSNQNGQNSNEKSGDQGSGEKETQNSNGQGNQQMQSGESNSMQSNQSQGKNNQQQNNGENQNQNGQEKQNGQTGGQGSNGQNDSDLDKQISDQIGDLTKQDVGHDTHSMWADAVKKNKEEQQENQKNDSDKQDKKQSIFDKLFKKNKEKSQDDEKQQDNGENKEKSDVEKKQEELEKMGEKAAFDKNNSDKKQQLQKLKEDLTKQASQAGNTPLGAVRRVDNIGAARPIVDWRYALREASNYELDWSYRNATIENGFLESHLEEIPTPETEIVIDTSGSIDEGLFRNFLRECKNILPHTRLKVGCFDTKFYGFKEVRSEKDIEEFELVGGGGTSFEAAVGAFSGRVDNKIIFTDGCAVMPDEPCDAIWIVFGDEKINPKGGKVIYVSEEDLRKLKSSGEKGRRR